jgi:hypothetical protein
VPAILRFCLGNFYCPADCFSAIRATWVACTDPEMLAGRRATGSMLTSRKVRAKEKREEEQWEKIIVDTSHCSKVQKLLL